MKEENPWLRGFNRESELCHARAKVAAELEKLISAGGAVSVCYVGSICFACGVGLMFYGCDVGLLCCAVLCSVALCCAVLCCVVLRNFAQRDAVWALLAITRSWKGHANDATIPCSIAAQQLQSASRRPSW